VVKDGLVLGGNEIWFILGGGLNTGDSPLLIINNV